MSVSVGVVLSHPAYTRPEEVIRDADTAMYRAKAEGPGHYVVFDETMRERADRRFNLGSELARGLERREFRVYYQPIVTLAAGRLVGFEALVRWQHPERGLLFPGDFISVAEETELIIELDRYVLRAACEQLSAWQKQFPQARSVSEPLFLSVNLSSKQFMREDLPAFVEQTLFQTELGASILNLEITENLLINQFERVDSTTAQLKALGVGLYLDDFGTGYSSLAYLQRFPADVLKIDRSFVQPLLSSAQSAELVRTVLVMARALGMRVVAEGVETREVSAQLSALGCEYGQGYLFAKTLERRGGRSVYRRRRADYHYLARVGAYAQSTELPNLLQAAPCKNVMITSSVSYRFRTISGRLGLRPPRRWPGVLRRAASSVLRGARMGLRSDRAYWGLQG